jgi:hypothetical protein
VISCAAE